MYLGDSEKLCRNDKSLLSGTKTETSGWKPVRPVPSSSLLLLLSIGLLTGNSSAAIDSSVFFVWACVASNGLLGTEEEEEEEEIGGVPFPLDAPDRSPRENLATELPRRPAGEPLRSALVPGTVARSTSSSMSKDDARQGREMLERPTVMVVLDVCMDREPWAFRLDKESVEKVDILLKE